MKKIIKILVLLIISLFALTGCEMMDNGCRLVIIKEYCDGTLYYDVKTGVEYFGKDRGMTVLLDADGKPIIYKEEK